jgi:O-antigen/teichoic acid export membrane protein
VHTREWFVGLAGAALLVSLFLPWLGDGGDARVSGWEWLSILDIYLALVALAALAVVFFTAQQQTQPVPLALLSLTVLFSIVAVIWLAIRLLTAPDGTSLEYGAWVALLATLGVTATGLWSMRDEHLGAPSRSEPPEMLPAP